MSAPKNPRCPHNPGTIDCLQVIWKYENLCQACPWWDEFCDEEDELIEDAPVLFMRKTKRGG